MSFKNKKNRVLIRKWKAKLRAKLQSPEPLSAPRRVAKVDGVLGEWLAEESCSGSWGEVFDSVLTSCCSQRFCKLCHTRENQGGRITLQYLVPQPSTLWPGQEGMKAEATYSGLKEWP